MTIRMLLWTSLLCVLTGIASGQLQNGDFDQRAGKDGEQPEQWQSESGTFRLNAKVKKQGTFGGVLNGRKGIASAYQDVEVKPGRPYVMTGSWRNADHAIPTDVARIEVYWLESSGAQPQQPVATIDSGEVKEVWTTFKIGPLLVPSSGIAAARIRLISTSGTAAFDQLSWNEPEALAGTNSKVVDRSESAGAKQVAVPADPHGSANSGMKWFQDVNAARRTASTLPVMVVVVDPDDKTSKYYEDVLFNDPGVVALLSSHFALVRLENTANRAAVGQLGIKNAGVIVFYSPAGRPLLQITDRVPVESFESTLRQVIDPNPGK